MTVPSFYFRNPAVPWLIALLWVYQAAAGPAEPDNRELSRQIARLVVNGSVMLNDESGNNLIAINPDKLLIPASIIKLLTSAAAIDILGDDFRFKTDFFTDTCGNIGVKGWGDPFLISEEIDSIARMLKQRGIGAVRRLYLDNSAFSREITIPGVSITTNPYDAINGALVVNFNSIYIHKDRDGTVQSAEKVTPITPLAKQRGHLLRPGSTERINLSNSRDDCLRYAGELFTAILMASGITVYNDTFAYTTIDTTWNLIYSHRNARDLLAISRQLHKYSNNFIANQLFLALGAQSHGYPATLEKGTQVIDEYIRNSMHIGTGSIAVYEGSGISRNNRATGWAMMTILEKYRNHALLLPEKRGALVKSGTLSGVSNYAGYIRSGTGLRPFVIILNQRGNYRDRILDLLKQYP